MKAFATEAIRNVAVIGHGDAGKTQLVSSLLHVSGTTNRWGKVAEGTTVTDYDEDSIERKVTLNTNLASVWSACRQPENLTVTIISNHPDVEIYPENRRDNR